MLHGRTEIAGFQPKLYKTLQKMASKTTSYTHKINGFGDVQGELITLKTQAAIMATLGAIAGKLGAAMYVSTSLPTTNAIKIDEKPIPMMAA
jgi:hypothetical protein